MLIFTSALDSTSPDDRAFILALYEEYKPIMYRAAGEFRIPLLDREDLVQEALSRLIPKIPELRTYDRCRLAGYVVFTVKNVARNAARHQRVRGKHTAESEDTDLADTLPWPGLTPEDFLLMRENLEDFYRIFRTLPETDQTLLHGKYAEGLSDKELAGMVGCQPASVRMKLTRARRRAMEEFMKGDYAYDKT